MEKIKQDVFLEKQKQIIESSGGYVVVKERLLYSGVYLALSLRLDNDKGETIEREHKEFIENRIFLFDFYIPNGISVLNIPANSIIEIKSNLIADSIHRINGVAKQWKQKYPASKVFLIYEQKTIISDDVLKKAKALKITDIYQIEEFMSFINKTKKLNDEVKREEENWKQKRKLIIDKARMFFHENNCTLFLGAGVSKDAGGPLWEDILVKSMKKMRKPLAKRDFKRIYKSCSMSPIIMGRYIVNDKSEKLTLINYLHDNVLYNNINVSDSELIATICKMVNTGNIESIITYNYDDIIEAALEQKDIKAISIYSKSRFSKKEFPVYHVHGLIPEKGLDIQSTPVLSEEDYHTIYRESYHWSNVEQLHALDRNTCFFIGLSMTDPNLRRLLDISHKDGDKDIFHFVFLKREKLYLSDFKHKTNELHFRILENQLEDIGVYVIWFEDFKEIPIILNEICHKLK